MISRLMLNLRDPNLVLKGRPGEPGMRSTAGVCPDISTLDHTNYPEYSNDGWVPADIFNAAHELDEENNGHRGPGRPSAGKCVILMGSVSSIMKIRRPNPRHSTYSRRLTALIPY